jgi:hypothetical protein
VVVGFIRQLIETRGSVHQHSPELIVIVNGLEKFADVSGLYAVVGSSLRLNQHWHQNLSYQNCCF